LTVARWQKFIFMMAGWHDGYSHHATLPSCHHQGAGILGTSPNWLQKIEAHLMC
jgi:hypothetical protein